MNRLWFKASRTSGKYKKKKIVTVFPHFFHGSVAGIIFTCPTQACFVGDVWTAWPEQGSKGNCLCPHTVQVLPLCLQCTWGHPNPSTHCSVLLLLYSKTPTAYFTHTSFRRTCALRDLLFPACTLQALPLHRCSLAKKPLFTIFRHTAIELLSHFTLKYCHWK